MAGENDQHTRSGRREFLLQVSAAAAAAKLALGQTGRAEEPASGAVGAAAPRPKTRLTDGAIVDARSPAPLPTIQLGPHRISRLVAGWNPIGGHSHTTLDMAHAMREYFTMDRTVEFLQSCERNGITAWQFDHTEKGVAAIQKLRQQGTKMKLICLHAERALDAPIQKVIDDTAPIAMVHHGGVTDSLFRAGKSQQVHDFVKKVHDHGLLAGVSAHNPDNIKQIADEGWENDFFMTCFYYVTRPGEDQQKLMGRTTVGEPFLESDPVEMTKVVRQVKQPCLGFKILAAGRACWSKPSVERAFKFAFANIKPIDGVIVGMFPRYSDEVAENAGYARKHGVVA